MYIVYDERISMKPWRRIVIGLYMIQYGAEQRIVSQLMAKFCHNVTELKVKAGITIIKTSF